MSQQLQAIQPVQTIHSQQPLQALQHTLQQSNGGMQSLQPVQQGQSAALQQALQSPAPYSPHIQVNTQQQQRVILPSSQK